MTQTGGIYKQPEPSLHNCLKPSEVSSDKGLLTEILQKYEGDPWLRLTRVEVTSACNIGDNYMSTVQRAHVEGVRSNDKPFHKHFIMKRQMENQEKRQLLQVDRVWANEEHMYFTVLPRLRRHCTTDLPHPKLYYSNKDLMIMEDLKEQGYSMVDRFLGLDLEHSLLVMKAIGLFHSSSLAMKILDDEMFNIMRENLKHPYNDQAGIDLGKLFMKKTVESAVELLEKSENDRNYEDLIQVLQRLRENSEQHIEFLYRNSWNRELSVVIHGDTWINNILFSYEENPKRPKICKFVDFQGTRMGSIALDILQFLYSSVQPEVRKQHYETLIRAYYDSLISYLKEFVGRENLEYVENLPFEKFEKELETFRFTGIMNAILLLPVITYEAQTEGSSSIFNIQRPYEQTYEGRLVEVLEEYKNNNWL